MHRLHREEIDSIEDEDQKLNKLIEINVKEQVMNLAKTSIIQKAWKTDHIPDLHGWVYALEDGIIRSIFDLPAGSHIDPIYEYDNL